jgi:hypothetical protein
MLSPRLLEVLRAWWRSAKAASCSLRLINNASPPITSAPARNWAKVARSP